MKFKCLKNNIKEAVSNVERITGKNLTLPILNSILIKTDDNNTILRSTNLEVGIEIKIQSKTINKGSVSVSGIILNNFLLNLYNNENLFFEENNGNLNITSEKNKISINCFPIDDFPTLPIINNQGFLIKITDFINGIKSVIYSSSISDIKPELSSVYIYNKDNFLIFVSTDSFRLAEKKIKIKSNIEFNNIIIPLKNAQEIIKIFEGCSGDVLIKFNKNQISLTYDNIYFTSRIIDGIFPDYKQIIPKEHKTEVIVIKQDLINALKISNVFSDKFNKVLMEINPKEKIFNIKTKNTNTGESSIEIDSSLTGDNLEINFNYKYMIDCFQSINQDSVVIQNNGLDKPIIIKGIGDDSFTYLVMPMNK